MWVCPPAIEDRAALLADADVILCVNGPDALTGTKTGAVLVGALDPMRRGDAVKSYAGAGLEALAMEWMPRITRAQSMDILSSQSNLAGYKAVVDAAAIAAAAAVVMAAAAAAATKTKRGATCPAWAGRASLFFSSVCMGTACI